MILMSDLPITNTAVVDNSRYVYAAFSLVVLAVLRMFVNPNPKTLFNDHVHFISASLGQGKTSLFEHWVDVLLKPPTWLDLALSRLLRKPLPTPPPIYTTFVSDGCKPLDLRAGGWPKERGAKIGIDEYLLLESNGLIPIQWLSMGCTLARQLGQQVVIISQNSRLANNHRKFSGTIGIWMTMRGISVGRLGRLVIVKRATEPFIRRAKGFKADGQRTSFVWIPGRVFARYQSRKIYGYTVDLLGDWFDVAHADNMAAEVSAVGVGAAHVTGGVAVGRGARDGKPKRVHRVPKAV